MHVKLVIVGGKANKSRVSVQLPTVVGRSREADLTVAHPMISRKHCQLYEVNGLVKVRDLGSLNGLIVGGTQVSEATLRPNAEFTVGPLTFRVEYKYVDEAPAPPDTTEANAPDGSPEGPSTPGGEIGGKGPDFELGGPPPSLHVPEGGSGGDQPADAGDAVTPSPETGIAPPGGELPDFSAWGEGETEPAEAPPNRDSVPPPPGLFGAAGQEPLAPGTDQGQPFERTLPFSRSDDAAFPETTASQEDEAAGTGPRREPPADAEGADRPPGLPAAGPDESDTPLSQPSPSAAGEGSGGSATEDEPEAADAEAKREGDADIEAAGEGEAEGEGSFDLALPPAPEADESQRKGPPDDLDEFLKGPA